MRRGRPFARLTILVTVFALFAVAPAAFAGGTPMDICKDLQDGKLDGAYTAAQLAAFVQDPTVQGYCGPIASSGTQPGPTAPPSSGSQAPATAGVLGASKTVSSTSKNGVKGAGTAGTGRTAAAPLAATRSSGTLPFTGAQLGLFALVGLALLATGLVLRSTGRPSQRR